MRLDGADYKGGILMFKTDDPDAIRLAATFSPGDYDLTVHKQRRSRDANNFCWVLCEEIASKLFKTTKEDVYRRAIQRVGVYKDFVLTEDEAKTFRIAWGKIGTGWITEAVDYDADGDRAIIRAYYGSSTYNTRQMSRLIDDLVQDAQALGIETDSGRITSLLADWEARCETNKRLWS